MCIYVLKLHFMCVSLYQIIRFSLPPLLLLFFYLILSMGGEDKKQMGQSPYSIYVGDVKDKDHQWEINGDQEDDTFNNGSSSSTSSLGDSTASNGSSFSSSDMADDASSSATSCSSTSSSNGPLSDLSDLMTQLPIKRGLSKFYDGKSQSFTSLSRVTSIEDLPKKESPYKRKMKASKSYGGGLDTYKLYTLPKPSISKKSSRSSLSSLSFPSRRGSFVSCLRPPLIPPPAQKNLGC